MKKLWSDLAWEQYLRWQNEDRKTLRKINKLLQDIERNGYNCIGKPEPLKGDKAGLWSVRIDKTNRITFTITENGLEIIQCGTHYGE